MACHQEEWMVLEYSAIAIAQRMQIPILSFEKGETSKIAAEH